ncbi:Transcriptional regulator, XRE family [Sinomonas atrocyanea]|uniref:Transcriptional regulator, XRE family n=1 Tax=Sinomonas atrocyanea TaxID=37927 RepID=A0A127A5T6_9MICC|nr:XRE family transcriptional regulator [Sinomonas atrocyanea]AMM34446.1 Transcriptional regulator, XRE family [Sinomonas atrocyanea]GEB65830.1 DNA-binding protein [Sinomonas atrocyanea]GGG61125.1 DNA-binding protein [Sinomonas atrocyanea]
MSQPEPAQGEVQDQLDPRARSTAHGDIGGRIRAARLEIGLPLRELARRLGISAGHISQVERGLVKPSISLIYSIADILGLGVGDLFSPESVSASGSAEGVARTPGEERFVTRVQERRSISLDTGVRWELLTPTTHEPVGFREIVYPVGSGSAQPDGFLRHSGREYGLILSGRLRVQLEFDEYELGPGDSIAFESAVPHRFWNDGPETVRAVWCTLAPNDDSAIRPAHSPRQ